LTQQIDLDKPMLYNFQTMKYQIPQDVQYKEDQHKDQYRDDRSQLDHLQILTNLNR
jgi:hypothetical protein